MPLILELLLLEVNIFSNIVFPVQAVALITIKTCPFPKRPLTPTELADAIRLKAAWEKYQDENKGATQVWLAKVTQIGNQSAIGQYLNKHIPLNVKALLAICKAIGADPREISPSLSETVPSSEFQDQQNTEPGPAINTEREYPLISWVQAGAWTEICDNLHPGDYEKKVPCHKVLGRCGYVLRVSGASMTAPPGEKFTFPEGFLLYVNPDAEVVPGKFVIVRRASTLEATFKRYILIDGEPYLQALNPDWPNRFIKLEEGDQFCGVVVHAGYDQLP